MQHDIPEIEFDLQEGHFIQKVFGNYRPPHYGFWLDMIIATLDKQFDPHKSLVTNEASILVDQIRLKIYEYKAAVEIERMLREPNNITFLRPNTKFASYNKLTGLSQKHQLILDTLEAEPDLSRREIAQRTGLLLQSVCGRVKELENEGLVKVTGKTFDKTTGRDVATISKVSK